MTTGGEYIIRPVVPGAVTSLRQGVRRRFAADTDGTSDGSAGDRPTSDDDPRISVFDVLFVVYVPVVLGAVFLLPLELRRDLALLYTQPSVRTMYASHFVHFDLPHLAANLLVYLLVVPFSVAVGVWNGRRRRFYLVAFVFLLVFPPVLSGLNILFPRPRIGLGFSGINMAFVGYLPHVLADQFEGERPGRDRTRAAFLPLAFFAGMVVVTVRVAGSLTAVTRVGKGWLIVAGAGSLFAALGYTRAVASCLRSQGVTGGTVPPLAAFGSLLFVLLVIVGFPTVSPEGGSIVNLFLHLLGFSLGYIVPYTAFQVFGISLDRQPSTRSGAGDAPDQNQN